MKNKKLIKEVDGVTVVRNIGIFEHGNQATPYDSVKIERVKYPSDESNYKLSIKVTKNVAQAILDVLNQPV